MIASSQSNSRFIQRWWSLLPALSISALILFPLVILTLSWLQPDVEVWRHFVSNQLWRISVNTFQLVTLVAIITGVLGTLLAWLVAVCEFPMRRWVEWMLVLPLAIPTYVIAFVYLGLVDVGGPVQSFLKGELGIDVSHLINTHSVWFVAAVLSLVLYPYVYLLARTTFTQQGIGLWEAARALGKPPMTAFFSVALPIARPAIIAGMSLVIMETFADFGAVAIFNYDTFSTAIYQTWFGLRSLNTAAQLSTLLLGLVALMILMERMTRRKARYYNTTRRTQTRRYVLTGWYKWLAVGLCWLVILVTFIIPVMQLISWSWSYSDMAMQMGFTDAFLHTVELGVLAAIVIVLAATSQVYAKQVHKQRWLQVIILVTTLGYALPGTVLAVGVMQAFAQYDAWLNVLFPAAGQQWLIGSIWAVVAAYVVRFDTAAFQTLESGVLRIRPTMVEAARSLGLNARQVLTRVYFPAIRPSVLSACLLVGVDVMKELPATLLLRPFGWDTLATRIYELTSEGEWEQSAPFALALLLVGLLPVILLIRRSNLPVRAEETELTLMQ